MVEVSATAIFLIGIGFGMLIGVGGIIICAFAFNGKDKTGEKKNDKKN